MGPEWTPVVKDIKKIVIVRGLAVSASLRINDFFAWLRLCQDQAKCAQSDALAYVDMPAVTKT